MHAYIPSCTARLSIPTIACIVDVGLFGESMYGSHDYVYQQSEIHTKWDPAKILIKILASPMLRWSQFYCSYFITILWFDYDPFGVIMWMIKP